MKSTLKLDLYMIIMIELTYQQLNAIYIYAGQNHYHFCFSELFVGHAYVHN